MSVTGFRDEEERIKQAYASRTGDHRYSWLNASHVFEEQQLERLLLRTIRTLGFESLAGLRILDIGCGKGDRIRGFLKWGATPACLAGVDILPERVVEAREGTPPGVELECKSAAALSYADNTFDIVSQFTVFTSILDADLRRAVAGEMVRVLKPGGVILWYDYHVPSPRNPDVRAVRAREIHELFPNCQIRLKRVTLAPPLARALARRAEWMCFGLSALPFLLTHYFGTIRKGAEVTR